MAKAEVTLPAAVSSVPTARHFTESILTAWSLSELAWPAMLIVSELAANAALHARGDAFTIRISSGAEGVRLEVSDSSARLPQQRSYADDATTGRGLRLVSSLAQDWGVDPGPSGKTIWVLLRAADVVDGSDDLDVASLLEAFADGEVIALPDGGQRPQAYAARAA